MPFSATITCLCPKPRREIPLARPARRFPREPTRGVVRAMISRSSVGGDLLTLIVPEYTTRDLPVIASDLGALNRVIAD